MVSPVSTNDCHPLPNVQKRNPISRLVVSVWNAVKKVFDKIAHLFSSKKYTLSPDQMKLFRKSEQRQAAKQHLPPDLSKRHVIVKAAGKEEIEAPPADPIYGNFKNEAMNFVKHALEASCEEVIDPIKLKPLNKFWDVISEALEKITPAADKIDPSWLLEGDDQDKKNDQEMVRIFKLRVEKFKQKTQENLIDGFPNMAAELLMKNGEKLGGLIIDRFIEVIDNSSFSDTCNGLVKLLTDHTEAVAEAENARNAAVKRHKELLDKCDQALNAQPLTDPKTEKARQDLISKGEILREEMLEMWEKKAAEQAPDEEEMRAHWLEEVGEEAARQTFKKFENVYHPRSEELAHAINNKNNTSLFSESAERLIKIFFPSEQVEDDSGNIHEVDGLRQLFSQIEYGSELKEFSEDLEQILQACDLNFISGLIRNKNEFIFDLLKVKLKPVISKILKSLFQQILIPAKADELIGYKALPSIQESLIESLANKVVLSNTAEFAPLFYAIYQTQDIQERADKRNELTQHILATVKEEIKDFPIEEDLLVSLINNSVTKLEEQLSGAVDQGLDIKTALDSFSKIAHPGQDNLYGKLTINTIFKIGNYGAATGWIADKLKGKISDSISDAMYDIQKSPQYLLDVAAKQISKHYNSKEAVHELIFEDADVPSSDEIQEKMASEIKKTVQVMDARIKYNLPFYAKFAVNRVVDKEKMEETITRIYQKVFNSDLYTQSLALNVQERFAKMLQQASV